MDGLLARSLETHDLKYELRFSPRLPDTSHKKIVTPACPTNVLLPVTQEFNMPLWLRNI